MLFELSTGCFGSRSSWEDLWCRSMSDTTYDWSGTPLWSYKSIQFVMATARPVCAGGKTKLCTKVSFHQHQAQGTPKYASTSLSLLVACQFQLWIESLRYLSRMRQLLNESLGRGKRCSSDGNSFNLGARIGPEATLQNSQYIPSLNTTCQVPSDLYGRGEFQEIIRPNRLRFVHVKGRLCIRQAYRGKMASVREPRKSVCPSAFILPELRVNGYKQDFVHWAFKKVPVPLLCLYLVNRFPVNFYSSKLESLA